MTPTPPPPRETETVTVDRLEQLGNGLWSVLLTFPDLRQRRIVIPKEVADLHGVRLSAGVVAELHAQGKLG